MRIAPKALSTALRHTYSGIAWDGGFQPVPYTLDFEKVFQLPVGDGTETVESVLMRLGIVPRTKPVLDGPIDCDEFAGMLTIKTPAEQLKLKTLGKSAFAGKLLSALVDLRHYDWWRLQWFWYDEDHVSDDVHRLYGFFVTCGDEIVRERVSFSDYRDNGFDPSVFEDPSDKEPIWSNEPAWLEAGAAYWYGKFYRETQTGQLMVLRTDAPRLFYLRETQVSPALLVHLMAIEQQGRMIVWLLLALVAAFLWRYF